MSPGLAGLPIAAPPAAAEVARWDFAPTVTAARDLRHEVLARWGDAEQDDDQPATTYRLALVLTELVTNAVQHGQGPIDVTLGRTPAGWLIVVCELLSPSGRPAPTPAAWRRSHLDAPETGGRGLSIVVAISTRCGWQRHDAELAVWAEVPMTAMPTAAVAIAATP